MRSRRRGYVQGLRCDLVLAARAEGVESPHVHAFIVPQNIEIPILGFHAEIDSAGRIPAVFHFAHFEEPPAQLKPQRMLIRPITGMALDAKMDDHAPPPVRPNGPSVAPHEPTVTQKATKIRAKLPLFDQRFWGSRPRWSQSDPELTRLA